MDALVPALAALLGLLVGSFLNVVIHRVPRAESLLRPGSHCPACSAPVRPWQNVPVLSWLALRGRCAACREPISVRYPLVELATALLFAAVAARLGATPELPAYLYLAAVAVALAMIDLDVQRLPNAIVLPSYAVGALLLLPAALAGPGWTAALRGLAAMAALYAFYFALAWFYPGGMGFGDVKLAGLLGLYLGWLGWSAVVIGTFAAFLLGGIAGVTLLATGRAGRKTALPFGPAMLAGALLALFAAGPIAAWYGALLLPSA
ncbi:prepilin peptidase [Planomonospora parontospora subsp. parontospora]|uniref:Prepilin peptidase n=2 Tax=Planomonospora parontospora TaxID=58119 RepID=A0AA37BE54_9ACTN|nr:A24 family peptidase [Planomonospora parontospora]GGK57155.1 prepilin peptidase [Planomonospora parontospora]GGL07606.1 prepilin peptidase [Planomonospora parontospora subsp. antibiotica]GII07737.1 prepilin peptidase [Planomonospora parontospora subsp. parontospora]GII14633.1 prepilin peptidase [Planomonospora parontospora subsp. antibiotica]